jgi:hypothetical protein
MNKPTSCCFRKELRFQNDLTKAANERKLALLPKHPERICWGCDKYCPADDLRCGNGTIRTQHPAELFGNDWFEWELGSYASEPQAQRQDDPLLLRSRSPD